MTEIDGIIQKIIIDAENRAKAIIKEAKAGAAEIASNVKDDITAKEKDAKSKASVSANLRAERIIASARLEGKKEYLAAKQALIENVFVQASSRLASLESIEYEKLIADMSKGIDGEIHLLPRDKEKGTGGGFIVKKGKVEYNFSFETLIKAAKEKAEAALVSILFG